MADKQKQGRIALLLIAAVFVVPILLAAYMYFSGSDWRPGATTQHGELISPPRMLPDSGLVTASGEKPIRGVWNLLVLADENCAPACIEALEHIRQIRLSLGPKMTRLQTVYLPAANSAIPASLTTDHPALVIVEPSASSEIRGIVGGFAAGQIFIVDPLGNLMMQYAPGTSMGDIRKDIGHLLKLSGIG
jgi:hypothetical protein